MSRSLTVVECVSVSVECVSVSVECVSVECLVECVEYLLHIRYIRIIYIEGNEAVAQPYINGSTRRRR